MFSKFVVFPDQQSPNQPQPQTQTETQTQTQHHHQLVDELDDAEEEDMVPETQPTPPPQRRKGKNNKGVSKINGLYNNLKTQRKSGQGDEEIFQEVLQFYLEEVGKPFKWHDCWKLLVQSPRWITYERDFVFGVQQSKRTKTGSSGYTTSSDARVGVDLNPNDELELEEIVRPMGRDKAKRKGKGTFSSASNFSVDIEEMRKITSSFDRYNLIFSERLAFDKVKEETRKKERAERQEMEDMKFLMENVDHLSGPALELV
ncbi:uncharacterized protein LOC128127644 [Lactuca sativa]|uniref:uncharacterized protein LOC128127644 n=1 Tax=Lactuca sativa TaxID=4236 RepID=UPI0022AF3F84|nr:uncharacterized protein LOC128127644 [Lactuca sativa]